MTKKVYISIFILFVSLRSLAVFFKKDVVFNFYDAC